MPLSKFALFISQHKGSGMNMKQLAKKYNAKKGGAQQTKETLMKLPQPGPIKYSPIRSSSPIQFSPSFFRPIQSRPIQTRPSSPIYPAPAFSKQQRN